MAVGKAQEQGEEEDPHDEGHREAAALVLSNRLGSRQGAVLPRPSGLFPKPRRDAARDTPRAARLVKLLGDGAMLRLTDATVGVRAALELVDTMSGEGALSSHAGVHTGQVIERDLDVFGQTVNMASRIADVAGPGEVLASQAVTDAADGSFAFERIADAELKGLARVPLFCVRRGT